MQLFTILTALSATIGMTFAADICVLSTSNCGGSASCCSGIQENSCCNFGTATTRIRWTLPNNSRAVAYANAGCTGGAITNNNPTARTVCFPFSSNRRSGAWFQGQTSRIKRDAEVEACAEPNMVLKVRDGVTKKIMLRDGQTADEVLESDEFEGEVVDTITDYEDVY